MATNFQNGLKSGGTQIAGASGTLYQQGTAIDASAAEITRAADISARVVTTSATALSLTVTEHAERVLLVNTNSTSANTFTLPTATGSGARFTIINNIAQTQGSVVVAANGTTDVMKGICFNLSTTEEAALAFATSASSDKITLNATTTGGEVAGDRIECIDSAANTWTVTAWVGGSGTLATPFSET